MSNILLDRANLDFMLFDWLGLEDVFEWPAFIDHSRDSVSALLDLSQRLAGEQFLTHYKASDQREPSIEGDGVRVLPEIKAALKAYGDAGFLAAPFRAEIGGFQLPEIVHAASMAFFMAANISTAAYAMLTIANARLIAQHGTEAQIRAFVTPQITGDALGTMCLSEPQAGSSLADIRTRAVYERPDALGGCFRLFGNKMWISGGDHDITKNIFHLVLAKISLADGSLPQGTAGISLFLVPKWLSDEHGACGERNDVVVAGLNHKMGYRGTANCLLNFGEGRDFCPAGQAGAIGYLVGARGQGLALMFHMMNEARVNVGLGAASVALRGHALSVEYARQRVQGRVSKRGSNDAPVAIIEHADLKRMLIAQKCYAEGALSLVLFCARLIDERRSNATEAARHAAELLLGLLTPAAKTWSSEWGLVANDIAIQIHGGYGYTRDFDVEQLYRDNRLNPIHEGTTGIQGIDFVARKLARDGTASLDELERRITATCGRAAIDPRLGKNAKTLRLDWQAFRAVALALSGADREVITSNASELLSAFGHLVVGWLWLDQASTLLVSKGDDGSSGLALAKLTACNFFFDAEMPRIARSLEIVKTMSRSVADIPVAAFDL